MNDSTWGIALVERIKTSMSVVVVVCTEWTPEDRQFLSQDMLLKGKFNLHLYVFFAESETTLLLQLGYDDRSLNGTECPEQLRVWSPNPWIPTSIVTGSGNAQLVGFDCSSFGAVSSPGRKQTFV